MTEPPKVTRFIRGLVVVLMAVGVVAFSNTALTMHHSNRTLVEHGIASVIGEGTTVFTVAVFLFFIFLFLDSLRTAIREWPTAPSSHFTTQNLGTRLGEAFTKPGTNVGPAYRWGMLAFILLLLAWNFQRQLNYNPAYGGDRYGGLVVALMLLLNHLAWSFRFPPTATLALRVLACGWLVIGCAYIL